MSPRDIPEGDLPAVAATPPARPKPAIALLILATGLGPSPCRSSSPACRR
ncbi:hypothetical protein ACFQY5_10565 [Paeniroseomonas aquatica]